MSISNKLSIKDVDVKNKRVLIRVNFNVMQNSELVITNNERIVAALPTIKYLQEQGASGVVLMSHLGQPNGQVVAKYSLKPVADELQKLLGQDVAFLSDCVGAEVENACADLTGGQVVLLENLRFHIEEVGSARDSEGNMIKADPSKIKEFRKSLAKLGDVYVNEAFEVAHTSHSSVVGIDLPVCAAGLLMQKELEYFGKVTEDPARPYLAILGGSKLSTKIQLIDSLLDKVDMMIITGGIAYTFLKVVSGMDIGGSLYDPKGAESAQKLVDKAKERGVEFVLPRDFMIAYEFSAYADGTLVAMEEGIPANARGLDIGPYSIRHFGKMIAKAKTIVWNGPSGVFEFKNFAEGTNKMMDNIIKAKENGATAIVVGGDSISAASNHGVADKFSHVSTGGAASLKLLEGKELPGVAVLSTK
ncbi:phosphoglycerate kinase [Coemansia sp. RSA 551]|nr:phosphoglycerate kinase [Coemansia sp. RSA 551]